MSDFQHERETLEQDKLRVEINKIIAETSKINQENRWYPVLIGAGGAAGLVSLGMLLLRLFTVGNS